MQQKKEIFYGRLKEKICVTNIFSVNKILPLTRRLNFNKIIINFCIRINENEISYKIIWIRNLVYNSVHRKFVKTKNTNVLGTKLTTPQLSRNSNRNAVSSKCTFRLVSQFGPLVFLFLLELTLFSPLLSLRHNFVL